MLDREKVIYHLNDCMEASRRDNTWVFVRKDIVEDAIALLKEQETTSTAESRLFHCEKCGYGIDDIYLSNEYDFDIDPHYCPNCGRKVKWE